MLSFRRTASPGGRATKSEALRSGTSRSRSSTVSTTSTTMSSMSSGMASSVAASFAQARQATSTAWSACKEGTRTTLARRPRTSGSSSPAPSLCTESPFDDPLPASSSPSSSATHSRSRRVRRLLRLEKTRYGTLCDDDADDGRDIFSGLPIDGDRHVRPSAHVRTGSRAKAAVASTVRRVYSPSSGSTADLAGCRLTASTPTAPSRRPFAEHYDDYDDYDDYGNYDDDDSEWWTR